MTLRVSKFRIGLVTVALAVCALMVCGAQAADRQRGRSIEFSAPRSDEVTTNLNQLTSKKDGLRQLDEELYRPLPSFGPQGSLDGVVAPIPPRTAPSAIQSKRAKELLERRTKWMFMRPEDLLAEPTAENILKAPDFGLNGKDKPDPRSMEQYYRRLATKHPGANRPGQSKDDDVSGSTRKSNSADETGAHDDSNLPFGLKETTQTLKSKFGLDKAGDPTLLGGTRSSFSDPFGLGDNTQTKEQELEHKRYMDDFHSQVDPTWQAPVVANSFSPPVDFAAPLEPKRSSAAGLSTVLSPAPHHGLDVQNDVLHPVLGPPGLPDVNARAVGQFRPDLAPKAQVPTKVATPAFMMPRRAL